LNGATAERRATSTRAAGCGSSDPDRLVGGRSLHQQRQNAFLHALLDVARMCRDHVGELRALRFGEDFLRAGLGAGAIAAERLGEVADAAARMLLPLRTGRT
jgi:hypothetical protein